MNFNGFKEFFESLSTYNKIEEQLADLFNGEFPSHAEDFMNKYIVLLIKSLSIHESFNEKELLIDWFYEFLIQENLTICFTESALSSRIDMNNTENPFLDDITKEIYIETLEDFYNLLTKGFDYFN